MTSARVLVCQDLDALQSKPPDLQVHLPEWLRPAPPPAAKAGRKRRAPEESEDADEEEEEEEEEEDESSGEDSEGDSEGDSRDEQGSEEQEEEGDGSGAGGAGRTTAGEVSRRMLQRCQLSDASRLHCTAGQCWPCLLRSSSSRMPGQAEPESAARAVPFLTLCHFSRTSVLRPLWLPCRAAPRRTGNTWQQCCQAGGCGTSMSSTCTAIPTKLT